MASIILRMQILSKDRLKKRALNEKKNSSARKAAKEREERTRDRRKARNAAVAREFYYSPHKNLAFSAMDLSTLNDSLPSTPTGEDSKGSGNWRRRRRSSHLKVAGDESPDSQYSSSDSLLKPYEPTDCIVCQDELKSVVLEPCQHMSLCRGCAEKAMKEQRKRFVCPLCWGKVTSMTIIER